MRDDQSDVRPEEEVTRDELFQNPDMGNDPDFPTDSQLDEDQRGE